MKKLIFLLFLVGCASTPSTKPGCPFGTVEWLDKDGLKCVRTWQMEQAIYRR